MVRRREYLQADDHHHEGANPVPSLLLRVSWGAIFAGAVIALGLTILFGLMGTALNLGAIEFRSGKPLGGLGMGTAIWWVLTSIVSLGIGGYVAGHASGQPERSSAMAHGAAMWGVVTVLTVWMASSAIGSAVNTATSAVTGAARASAQVVGGVGGILPDDLGLDPALRQARERIRSEAEQMLSRAGLGEEELQQAREEIGSAAEDVARRPGQLDEEVGRLVDSLFDGEDAVFSPAERQSLVEELSTRAGVTPEEADRIADRWEEQAQSAAGSIGNAASELGDAVARTGDDAVDALSSAAWYAFFASLLSLAAAIGAAAAGAPSRPYVERRRA